MLYFSMVWRWPADYNPTGLLVNIFVPLIAVIICVIIVGYCLCRAPDYNDERYWHGDAPPPPPHLKSPPKLKQLKAKFTRKKKSDRDEEGSIETTDEKDTSVESRRDSEPGGYYEPDYGHSSYSGNGAAHYSGSTAAHNGGGRFVPGPRIDQMNYGNSVGTGV